MNKFNEELIKNNSEELPELKVHKLSKKYIDRIERNVYSKIANEENSLNYRHFSHSVITLKRLITIVTAAILLIIASVTSYAYRGEIAATVKRILTREEELIDSKADIINETAQNEEVSLTVVKAVQDAEKMYLYLNLTANSRDFDGAALMYDSMVLERMSVDKYKREQFDMVTQKNMGKAGLLAGDMFHYIGYKPVSEIDVRMAVEPLEAGTYRLTFNKLFTLDERDDNGEFKSSPADYKCIEYADSLSVAFDLEEITEKISVAEYEPMTDFEIGNVTLTLTKLKITPNCIRLEIKDMLGQSFELGGYTYPAIDYLVGFCNPKGIDISVNNNENSKRKDYINDALEKGIYDNGYKVKIKFRGDISSVDTYNEESYGIAEYNNFDLARSYIRQLALTSPVYESDIESIYLECFNGGIITIWGDGD